MTEEIWKDIEGIEGLYLADNLEWCTHKYNMHYGKNKRSKRVAQMDMQGNVIAEFESTRDAANGKSRLGCTVAAKLAFPFGPPS